MIRYLLPLTVFLSACADDPVADRYAVLLDPSFTPDELAQVETGLGLWLESVPVSFDVRVEACDNVYDGVICIHSSDAAKVDSLALAASGGVLTGATTTRSGVDGGEVWLDVPDMTRKGSPQAGFLTAIAAHEIGHAMGLPHLHEGSLMYAVTSDPGARPMCEDVSEWRKIHGLSEGCAVE